MDVNKYQTVYVCDQGEYRTCECVQVLMLTQWEGCGPRCLSIERNSIWWNTLVQIQQ